MRLLASDFQMSAAREVAINIFFAYDLLNQINRPQGCRVHAPRSFDPVPIGKSPWVQLEAGQHHASVAGTCAPSDAVRFEDRDCSAAFCQCACSGEPGESGANNGRVHTRRQLARSACGHGGCTKPVIGLVKARHLSQVASDRNFSAASSGVISRCGFPSISNPTMNFRTVAERNSGG